MDASNNHTDAYSLIAYGMDRGGWLNTPNPYRFGGAWGYLTDPSGMLQLGARYYWPEVGRFVQQDPAKDGLNWYAYGGSRPTVAIDPEGLWEIGVEGYALVGGGVWCGVDPCTRNPFVRARRGLGIGFGLGLNPTGGIPGGGFPGTGRAPGFAAWAGASANAGYAYGPVDVRGGLGAGVKVTPRGLLGYGSRPSPSVSVGAGWQAGIGGSVGVDVGVVAVPMPF